MEKQRLFVGDDLLEDDRTVVYYNIRKGSLVNMEVPPEMKRPIYVKTPTGDTITIEVLECNTIKRIKTQNPGKGTDSMAATETVFGWTGSGK